MLGKAPRRRNRILGWALPVALLICPTPSAAQDGRYFAAMGGTGYFAVMGGTAVPFGGVGDASDAQVGLHLSARFDFGVAFDRLRGRIEIAYDRFGVRTPEAGRPTLIPVIFTLGLPLARSSGIRPYLAAGAGAYYYRDGRTDDNQFGVSGGVGLLHRFVLAEIRYHAVPGRGDRYLTVEVGVRT